MPPLAENPPTLPPAASTRWQGTTRERGFCPGPAPRRGRSPACRAALRARHRSASRRVGRTRCLVDAAVEGGHAVEVQRTPDRSRGSPRSSPAMRRDRAVHRRRWRRFAGAGRRSTRRARVAASRASGKLHANDAARAPGDTAAADGRVEEREPMGFHATRSVARPWLRVPEGALPLPCVATSLRRTAADDVA